MPRHGRLKQASCLSVKGGYLPSDGLTEQVGLAHVAFVVGRRSRETPRSVPVAPNEAKPLHASTGIVKFSMLPLAKIVQKINEIKSHPRKYASHWGAIADR